MEKKENQKKEIINNKNDALKDRENIEFLIKEIKKKDELIEILQKENKELNKKNEKEISLLKDEIKNLKLHNEKEMKSLKEYFEEKLNLKQYKDNEIINVEEEDNNIINEKNNSEENIENEEKSNDIKNLKDLNDKYNKFEKNFENKLDLIQKSLSKLIVKEGVEKDYSKEFENKLNKIFSEQNDKISHVSKKDLEDLKRIGMELMKDSGPTPLEKTRNFFEQILNKRINETNNKSVIANLAIKKNEIFEYLDNLELELNFNIPKFRKEFNLPKEDYSDEFLLLKCKENNWDTKKAFCDIINQKYS